MQLKWKPKLLWCLQFDFLLRRPRPRRHSLYREPRLRPPVGDTRRGRAMHPQLATKGNNLQLPVDINSLKMKAETTLVFLHVEIMLDYFYGKIWMGGLPASLLETKSHDWVLLSFYSLWSFDQCSPVRHAPGAFHPQGLRLRVRGGLPTLWIGSAWAAAASLWSCDLPSPLLGIALEKESDQLKGTKHIFKRLKNKVTFWKRKTKVGSC